MENVLFAIAVGGYLVAGFAWPTLRLWRHHSVWPIVFDRESAPAQRLLGFLSGALLLGLLALVILHLTLGREALGVWALKPAVRGVGWLVLLFGAVVTVVAQCQMGTSWRVGIDDRPTDLVTGGLFRHVRNPIFTGLLLFVAGVVILSPAWWSIAVLVLTAAGLRLQVAFEENHLIALHGGSYLTYAARTGRFVPLLGRLHSGGPTPNRSSGLR